MERRWYKNNFDKVEGDYVPTAIEISNQKVMELYKKRIKKLPMNIIECIVGIALLVLCYNYIQTHPAEKSSLLTGIDVLVQKFRVNVMNVKNWQWEDVQRKFELMRRYDEILSTALQGNCLDESDVEKIRTARKSLEDMSAGEFLEKESAYSTVSKMYYTKVKSNCLTDSLDEE